MHRTKIKVAEDALDANETIARANRDDFDRAGVRVVNLMSAPGAGKTTLLEAALRELEGVASGRARGRRRRVAWTPTGSRPAHPGDPAQHGQRLRRRVPPRREHGALRDPVLDLDGIDLLVIENVGNLVCPAEFRVGEDVRAMITLGHRGRGQAAQVPADVPRLRAGRDQQDRPAAAPGLRRRSARSPTSTPSTPAPRRCWSAPARAKASTRSATGSAGVPARAGGRRLSKPSAWTSRSTERLDELLAVRSRGQRGLLRSGGPSGSPPAATGWRSGSRAAGAWSRSGSRRSRAPTSATSPSSSSIR